MKQATRQWISLLLVVAYALTLLGGLTAIGTPDMPALADDTANADSTYYYGQLGALPQRFYRALQDMHQSGLFKTGTAEYDLIEHGVLTEQEVASYIEGAAEVPVAFGAARDAYYMDHPELFYVDIYNVMINVGREGSDYFAYLGVGRSRNYYASGFDSVASVDAALARWEQKLNAVVAEADTKTEAKDKIAAVNAWLVDPANVQYDWDLYDNRDGGVNASQTGFTAYGALVDGKAVCSGYSRAFKAAMDKLGIDCVSVSGYGLSKTGYANHEWNYVRLDDKWYAVDTTWNSADAQSATRYLLVGENTFRYDHMSDSVISTSGYELPYPSLNETAYGVSEDEDGLVCNTKYDKDTDSEDIILTVTLSYQGKGARKLKEEDGLTLIVRLGYEDSSDDILENVDGIYWSPWVEYTYCQTLFNPTDSLEGMFTDIGGATCSISVHSQVKCVQVAVTASEPDEYFSPLDPTAGIDKHAYNSNLLLATYVSEIYENEKFGSYVAPAYPSNSSLPTGELHSVMEEYTISTQYSEPLTKVNPDLPVGVQVTSIHDDIAQYVSIGNVVWDEVSQTLSFTFTPSQQYLHNFEYYHFVPTNLVSAKAGGKAPHALSYHFGRRSAMCPKVLGGGRLYMQFYGQPSIVDTQDLSMSNFEYVDEQGNTKMYSQNQVSQLMLVVTDVPDAKEQEMQDVLNDASTDLGLSQEAIASAQSATYEIELQICAKTAQRVKAAQGTNSFMQVGIGFPGGKYDANKVYKVYHYTHDEQGNITGVEEVPVIINEYGIVATVESFSPFMVMAFDADKVAQDKVINATVVDGGGRIAEALINNAAVYADNANTVRKAAGAIYSLQDGDTVTYVLAADDGFVLDTVTLNGRDITADVQGGRITLQAAALDTNNVVEVTFVAQAIAQANQQKGRETVHPAVVVTAEQVQSMAQGTSQDNPPVVNPPVIDTPTDDDPVTPDPAQPADKTGLIVGLVVGLVLSAAVCAVVIVVVKKSKSKK